MNDSDAAVASMEEFLFRVTTILPEMPPETAANFTSTLASIPATAQSPPAKSGINIIAYCYVMPIICVVGIIGNLMNVVTLASPRLRAVSYMYLRALAIADLLCMLFVLAFACCEVLKEAGVPIERQPLYGVYQAHVMLSVSFWYSYCKLFPYSSLSTGHWPLEFTLLSPSVWNVMFPLFFHSIFGYGIRHNAQ
jgi:hypothetical protein